MKTKKIILIVVSFVIWAAVVKADGKKVYKQFRAVEPSVVLVTYIETFNTYVDGSTEKLEKFAAGVVVSAGGLVMTHGNVFKRDAGGYGSLALDSPDRFKITLHNGKTYKARFYGKEGSEQLVFLQIIPEKEGETFAHVSFKDRITKPGDAVTVIDFLPDHFKRAASFTAGMVTNVVDKPFRQYVVNISPTELMIGNLVLNEQGEAIGIIGLQEIFVFGIQTSAYVSVIPAKRLLPLIEDPPLEDGEERAWLGMEIQPFEEKMAEYWNLEIKKGVLISNVISKSPAEKAGLSTGDVISEYNDEPVFADNQKDIESFIKTVSAADIGEPIRFKLFRDGEEKIVTVIPAARPKSIELAAEYRNEPLGFVVKEITFDISRMFNLDDMTGVYVFKIEQAGPAFLGGLKHGDIVKRVNNTEIISIADFRQIIEKARGEHQKELLLLVQRGINNEFLVIKTEWEKE